MIPICIIWDSKDERTWKVALGTYWVYVSNKELEEELELLDLSDIRGHDERDWYEFLHRRYFPWKYTDRRWLSKFQSRLASYETEGSLDELIEIKDQLLSLDLDDILGSLKTAHSIRGLGVAGASGLLALMYPTRFATVDRFVVDALEAVPGLPEAELIGAMTGANLQLEDAVTLIQIMRRKAEDANQLFETTFWTPRKIDKILWAYGHPDLLRPVG